MTVKQKRRVEAVLFYFGVTVLAVIMAYPLLWMVASSVKPNEQIFTQAHKLIPTQWRWENYVNGWKGFAGTSFGVFFSNSMLVAVLATIGSVLASVIVAYGFARLRFKGKQFWFVCMMGTMLLPEQILIVPQYIMYKHLGWINTFLPLIVPYWCSVPFFVFLNMQFMRGIPGELDEAAMIDGCGKFQILFHIILPLSRSAVITSTIFSFYWRWQDFLGPLIFLSKPQRYTFSVAIKMFADPTLQTDWGAMFAMAALSLVPVCVIFLFFQKYLVEGIAASGIKG